MRVIYHVRKERNKSIFGGDRNHGGRCGMLKSGKKEKEFGGLLAGLLVTITVDKKKIHLENGECTRAKLDQKQWCPVMCL